MVYLRMGLKRVRVVAYIYYNDSISGAGTYTAGCGGLMIYE